MIPDNARVLEIGCGNGDLLNRLHALNVTGVDLAQKPLETAKEKVPHGDFYQCAGEKLSECEGLRAKTFDYIIISETVNYSADVQELFHQLQAFSNKDTRLVINFFNTLWKPVLMLLTSFGLRSKNPSLNWLSHDDTKNLMELSKWELMRQQSKILIPIQIPIVSTFLNKYLAPFFPWFCWTIFQVARSRQYNIAKEYSVSVVIPARNEAGNIQAAIDRTPDMGTGTEIIFIEGNSTDNTWETIQKAKEQSSRNIRIMQQSGKGKGNAVRDAYAVAKGEILMILDADLTVPPEELPKFYNAVASGQCDYANGVRLVYPMEKKAMRFLNMCGNKFFSIAFSWALGQNIKDTLCGTKVMLKTNYEKIATNRSYFGDFDPFGDFDLIFGSAKLNMKFSDIPIRYRERTYGDTNIDRWSHGWLLIKMLFFSLKKIKFV
ncbi:glycosyltransferase [bacterium]|nr:glycosyltransferase [bacterium]